MLTTSETLIRDLTSPREWMRESFTRGEPGELNDKKVTEFVTLIAKPLVLISVPTSHSEFCKVLSNIPGIEHNRLSRHCFSFGHSTRSSEAEGSVFWGTPSRDVVTLFGKGFLIESMYEWEDRPT